MTIQDYVLKGITIRNNMGEIRKPRMEEGYISIPFKNGWVASISKEKEEYNVAVCDYEGYFNWNVLKSFGKENGTIDCKTEEEVCNALSIIEKLK